MCSLFLKSHFYCLSKCDTWNPKNDEHRTRCITVTRETGCTNASKKTWDQLIPCNMKGLVFPSWVLSNALHYYHHFPLSRSSPDTPQRAALSRTGAFAMLPWKHSHGIAHYRKRHLHVIPEKLFWGGERFQPRCKKKTKKKKHCNCLLLKPVTWILREDTRCTLLELFLRFSLQNMKLSRQFFMNRNKSKCCRPRTSKMF